MLPPFNARAVTHPPLLETERLVLKPVTDTLRPFVFQGLSDTEVRARMKLPVLDTRAKQDAWWQRFEAWHKQGKAVQWCAFSKKTGQYLALLTIKEIDQDNYRGEIGYSVMKEAWGQGFGKEGAAQLVQYAFAEIGLHSLFAVILPYNIPSQRIVKGLGFSQEGHFKEEYFFEGKFHDTLRFGMLNPSQ